MQKNIALRGRSVVIRGGTVFDGSGAPGKRADVAIAGGWIAATALRLLAATGDAQCVGASGVGAHRDRALSPASDERRRETKSRNRRK